jgi:hypothetical protein
LGAVALEENGMALEAGRAAVVRLCFALLGPVVLDNHAKPRVTGVHAGAARGARGTTECNPVIRTGE